MNKEIINWKKSLNEIGYFKTSLKLPENWKDLVQNENWEELDCAFNLFSKESSLTKLLSQFCSFTEIEFIISIRDYKNPWEEDGIWHDDGSRVLAFSLSLTTDIAVLSGGVLEIRKKGILESSKIAPFPWGEIVVFATGKDNFEHKINQVTSGKRIIIAGWCS